MRKTKTIVLFLFLLVTVPGCTPGYSGDPNTLIAIGQAGLESTAAAQVENSRRATMAAGQLRDAINATQAAAGFEAQQTAFALEVQAASAERTREAASATGTAVVRETETSGIATATAVSGQATSTAIGLEIEKQKTIAENEAGAQVFWLLFWPCSAMLILGGVLVAGIKILEVALKTAERNLSTFDRYGGTVAWFEDPETGRVKPFMIAARVVDSPPRAPRVTTVNNDNGGVEKLTASGSVLMAPMMTAHIGVKEKAIRLIKDAVAMNGEGSNVIPGWRNLEGWESEPWQYVVRALKAARLAETSNAGTATTKPLGDLLYELETGKIRLRPAREDEE